MTRPELTFFCELDGPLLADVFDRPEVLPSLQALSAKVSLGIIDFSPERAALVQKLNQAGIPVTAWLLLPQKDGYWFNLENIDAAENRWREFLSWSAKHRLDWAGVGLDIEPDIGMLRRFSIHPGRTAISLLIKVFLNRDWKQRQERYIKLANQICAAGYWLEAYQFPVILEERRGRSRLLLRLLGLVDLPVDREVLMLYSSFLPEAGAAVLASYLPDAGAVGIGVTGGGVIIEGTVSSTPLNWEAFKRDLRMTAQCGKPAYIFSLEGCVWRGWLSRLVNFEWKQPADRPPVGQVKKVNRLRLLATGLLFIASHPLVLLIGLWALMNLLRRKKTGG